MACAIYGVAVTGFLNGEGVYTVGPVAGDVEQEVL